MDRLNRDTFYVSDWRVEPLLHRVSRHGRTRQVEPKLIDVLVYLAVHAGQVVTREAILTDVWPDTVVTDHALTRSISELRKVLDDDSKEPSIIETIPKTGYRLVAPISFAGPSSDGEVGETTTVSYNVSETRRRPITQPVQLRVAMVVAGLAVLTILIVAASVILGDQPTATSYSSRPLTSLPGREMTPVFSPDGERIAFAWSETLFQPNRDIHVKHLNSETSIPVTSGEGQNVFPTWSPDGDRLAFLRFTPETCGIYTVSALGTSERKLDDCPFRIKDLAWSPDGAFLAFAGREASTDPHRLYLLNLETLERRQLTNPPAHIHGDDQPVFSPDGKSVGFRRSRVPGVNDLYSITLGPPTGKEVRRTFDQRTVYGYDWTADGQEMIYSSNRSGLFRLWRTSLSDDITRAETGISAWDPGRPTISRRGNRLAFVEWFFEVNIWQIPVGQTGDDAHRVASSTRGDYLPTYSPDGRRIAFSSNRSGSSEIWVANGDGSDPLRLTDLGHAATRSPNWSPDGRRIAFESVVDGYSRIYVIDAEGGSPQLVLIDTTDAIAPSWSADGASLYFGSNRDGDWQIWKIRADGGAPQKMTHSSGYVGRESPDGSTLFFTRYDLDGIWSLDLNGGAERRVVDEFPSSTWTAWTLRDDGLYFLRRGDGTSLLFKQEYDDGVESEIAEFNCTYLEHGSGLSVSPDGNHLLTSCIDRAESDVMLVENYR